MVFLADGLLNGLHLLQEVALLCVHQINCILELGYLVLADSVLLLLKLLLLLQLTLVGGDGFLQLFNSALELIDLMLRHLLR